MLEKKESLAKTARRDIATLIERNKLETARIKTESIIHDDIHVELLEILELYCELLTARFGLLDTSAKEPDPGVYEAVCAVIHAATHTELKGMPSFLSLFTLYFPSSFWSLALLLPVFRCALAFLYASLLVAFRSGCGAPLTHYFVLYYDNISLICL